jgi:subtilisin-like proprotein convertase family protein
MKARHVAFALCWMAALGTSADRAGAQVQPQPIAKGQIETLQPYRLTGLIDAYYGTGSGVVVAHPRVVLSCAHVIYDADFRRWLSGARWFRGYNEDSGPERPDGQVLNGYFYWRAYAAAFRASERARRRPFGGLRAIAREFNLDAVAYFSYRDNLGNGEYASVFADGAAWLETPREKWITGYPSGRYREGDPLEFRQHVTGSFSSPLRREVRTARQYLTLENRAETGSGNSGGPVWMRDPDNNSNFVVAGLLVSGAERIPDGVSSIGVHATSARSWRLISSAVETTGLGSAAPTLTASFTEGPVDIPDAVTRVVKGGVQTFPGEIIQSATVSGMPTFLNDVRIDLLVEHDDQTDLLILIQPPRQLRYPVYDGFWDERGNEVRLDDEDVPMFYGINPNGRWRLYVVDMVSGGDTGRLISAKIRVNAR